MVSSDKDHSSGVAIGTGTFQHLLSVTWTVASRASSALMTQMCGAVDLLEWRDAIQRLETVTCGNLTKFNTAKCKVLHLGQSNPNMNTDWVINGMMSSPATKCLQHRKLTISWAASKEACPAGRSWGLSPSALPWCDPKAGAAVIQLYWYELNIKKKIAHYSTLLIPGSGRQSGIMKSKTGQDVYA